MRQSVPILDAEVIGIRWVPSSQNTNPTPRVPGSRRAKQRGYRGIFTSLCLCSDDASTSRPTATGKDPAITVLPAVVRFREGVGRGLGFGREA
jgi:hypothetical protein